MKLEMELTKPRLIIAGATGLIGSHAIQQIAQIGDHISHVYSVTRRRVGSSSADLTEIVSNTLSFQEGLIHAELGLICLGTTKKQSGSNQALYAIDHDLVIHVAEQMKACGVKKLAVVSSYGATPNSSSHYLRCKGEMERDVAQIGFDKLLLVRPGPLQGQRETPRSDEVMLQHVFKVIKPIMIGPLYNLRPIRADCVAQFMLLRLLDDQLSAVETANYKEIMRYLAISDSLTK